MADTTVYLLAADFVLLLHISFVLFVILGLVLIIVGGVMDWRWVRRRAWRTIHLASIGIVVVQSWLGVICPLTTIEMALRNRAGDASYAGSFIAYWLEALLYYQAPAWVFAVCYSAFAGLIVLSWIWVRPSKSRKARPS